MNDLSVSASVQVAEGIADAAGTKVKYFDAGPVTSDRLPIVLIHGTSGSTQQHFGYLFPLLAVRQRVISVELAPPADLSGDLTLEHLEAQVLAVIAAAAPGQKVTLLGYSLGAAIAAFVAARHPRIVENLVLLAGWMKTDMQQLMFNRVWRELRDLNSPAIADFTIFAAFGSPFLATKTFADMPSGAAMPLDAFVDRQMELNRRIDLTDLVPTIKARTLIIACRYDQMVPIHHSKALFGAIEDARYTEVASGHAVVFERPAEILRLVDNFSADPAAYPAGFVIPEARP